MTGGTGRTLTLERVVLCHLDDVAPGSMRQVVVEGVEPLAVYHLEGEVRVTADTCTHAQAFLTEGDLEGDRVVCPAHWAEFDVRTGAALCFPATRRLAVYPSWVEGNEIVADLSNVTRGDS